MTCGPNEPVCRDAAPVRTTHCARRARRHERTWDDLQRRQGGQMTANPKPSYTLAQIPRGVWVLGFVSMLMDISSEMIHALLPVYLVTVFGASMVTVGVIEGIAEATASITKIFSGALSDWLGRRKWLAAFGYGLAALTRPVFPLAPDVGWLVAARFVDRVGKGIRGARPDAPGGGPAAG